MIYVYERVGTWVRVGPRPAQSRVVRLALSSLYSLSFHPHAPFTLHAITAPSAEAPRPQLAARRHVRVEERAGHVARVAAREGGDEFGGLRADGVPR